MKITITIPDEYKEEWYQNRFEQTLQRLKADANLLAGKYEKETADMLTEAFKNGHEYKMAYCKKKRYLHPHLPIATKKDISMTDTYRGGYKKAILDLRNFLQDADNNLGRTTLKKYRNLIQSSTMTLLQDPKQLDKFMDGLAEWLYNPETGEMKTLERN